MPCPKPLFSAEFSDSVGSVLNVVLLGVFLIDGCESLADRDVAAVDVERVETGVGVSSGNKIISSFVCLSIYRVTASSLVTYTREIFS